MRYSGSCKNVTNGQRAAHTGKAFYNLPPTAFGHWRGIIMSHEVINNCNMLLGVTTVTQALTETVTYLGLIKCTLWPLVPVTNYILQYV